MRHFTVNIDYDMIVYAEDQHDARNVALKHAIDGLCCDNRVSSAMSVRRYPEDGPPEFSGVIFGHDNDCALHNMPAKTNGICDCSCRD